MQIRNHSLSAIACCVFALAAASAAQEHHPDHDWDYGESQGPAIGVNSDRSLLCARTGIVNRPSTSAILKTPTYLQSSSITSLPRYTSSITATLS